MEKNVQKMDVAVHGQHLKPLHQQGNPTVTVQKRKMSSLWPPSQQVSFPLPEKHV